MSLKNKTAIVTGGASGIGEACSETLAREGAKVLITDIDDLRGRDVVQRIAKAGGTAHYINHDVRDEAAWPGIVAEAEKRFGRLDIMVANAGIGIMSPISTMTLADWQKQQAINLDGVFLSIKHSIPAMKKAGGGSIVLMSSVAGLRGAPGLAAYSATKGGVRLLAKSVALEHAADNIRCNSVHPGIIATPIWDKAEEVDISAYKSSPYFPALERMRKYMLGLADSGLPAEKIGELVHEALTLSNPRVRYEITPEPFRMLMMRILPKRMLDGIIAKQLGLLPRTIA